MPFSNIIYYCHFMWMKDCFASFACMKTLCLSILFFIMSFLRKQESKFIPAQLVPAEAGSGKRVLSINTFIYINPLWIFFPIFLDSRFCGNDSLNNTSLILFFNFFGNDPEILTSFYFLILTIWAGEPAATANSGISELTKELVPITLSLPILHPSSTFAPDASQTLSPISIP